MHVVSLNINCAERSGRAEVLAGTAADALALVYGRHLMAIIVNHQDGFCRAVSGTVAARYAIGEHNTVFLDPHRMTSMDGSLFFSRNGLDGSRRADLTALCTFRAAIASFKRHHGLHEVLQIRGGAQDIVRT